MGQDSIVVNPFQLTFDALWSMLENSPVFTTDVAVGNRIHYNRNTDRNPFKPNINDSDLPEVMLVPTGGTLNLVNTSSTSKCVKRYQWYIATGDVRVNNWIHQIEWDLVIAMTGWDKLLGALIWPVDSGKNFCKRYDVLDISEGLNNSEQNRGIPGWAAAWTAEVEMHFQTSDLVTARGY